MTSCSESAFLQFLQSQTVTLKNTKSFPDSLDVPVNNFLTFTTNEGDQLVIVGRGNQANGGVNEIQIYELDKNLAFIRSIKQVNPENLQVLTIDNVHYICSAPYLINYFTPSVINIYEISTGILKWSLTQTSTYEQYRFLIHVFKNKNGDDVLVSANSKTIFQWNVKTQTPTKLLDFPDGLYGPTELSSYFDSNRNVMVLRYGNASFAGLANAETGENIKIIMTDYMFASQTKYKGKDALMFGNDAGYIHLFDFQTYADLGYQINYYRQTTDGYVMFSQTIQLNGKSYLVICYNTANVYIFDLESGSIVSQYMAEAGKAWQFGDAAFITINNKPGLIQLTKGSFMLFEIDSN